MKEVIGFIGTGNLGLPMAINLLESGYPVKVFNRTSTKSEPLKDKGAEVVPRAADVVTSGGVVISVLWDANVVEDIVSSNDFLKKLGKGGLHICMCTGSPDKAKSLAKLHQAHDVTYLDCPVFGRAEAAAAKQLWIPFSGPSDAKQRARPILEALGAQGIFDFGEDIGAATMVKLVGNFMIASMANTMQESVNVAQKTGLDSAAILSMLTSTLFDAPIFKNYARILTQNKTSPFSQTAIPEKDLGLFIEAAKRVQSKAPIAELMSSIVRSKEKGT